MALLEKKVDWTQLISFTSNGLMIADFVQIKNSLIQLFKSIYGDDIDVSTGTVDGIYVDNVALLINNILQSFKNFYSQLDVNTAFGKYLENLCKLTNVTRKSATYSNVYLVISSPTNLEITRGDLPLKFLDSEGNTWSYNKTLNMQANKEYTILVTCDNIGPVRAIKGSINKLVNTDMILNIKQEENANVGSYSETDSQLRARRNQYLGNYGVTVLESLSNALLNISGIEDVKIYNNNSGSPVSALDSTEVEENSVYIILKKRKNIVIEDSIIGSIIYQKMTPGILTVPTTDSTYGINKSYDYPAVSQQISQEVHWKEAVADHPTITINITPQTGFASSDNSTLTNIAQNLIEYLNNLPLESNINIYNIINNVIQSDLKFRGNSTFIVSYQDIKINNENKDYTNKGTYYEYDISNAEYSESGSYKVITLK